MHFGTLFLMKLFLFPHFLHLIINAVFKIIIDVNLSYICLLLSLALLYTDGSFLKPALVISPRQVDLWPYEDPFVGKELNEFSCSQSTTSTECMGKTSRM